MATTKNTVNTTTGINSAGIPKIIKAIENYKKAMEKKIDLKATKVQIQKAIKGPETEKNLTKMVTGIETQMEALMRSLQSRQSELEAVLASYDTHDKGNQTFTNAAGIKADSSAE